MLKGIDHRLNADVLYVLRSMGHGDALVIADTNFPSDQVARATVYGDLLRMENLTAAEAVQAVLSVMPLDTFVDDFAGRMEVVGDAAADPGRPDRGSVGNRQGGGAAAAHDRHRKVRFLRPRA
jgi:L-fucose mutarotase